MIQKKKMNRNSAACSFSKFAPLRCSSLVYAADFCVNSTAVARTGFERRIGAVLKRGSACALPKADTPHSVTFGGSAPAGDLSQIRCLLASNRRSAPLECSPYLFLFFFFLFYTHIIIFSSASLITPSWTSLAWKKPTFPQLIPHKLEQFPHDALFLFIGLSDGVYRSAGASGWRGA